jgi:hypothetical protein
MTEYTALKDVPFDSAELHSLIEEFCLPRVAELNFREVETRSGLVLRNPKRKSLSSRIEHHYRRLAPHVLELHRRLEQEVIPSNGACPAATELLFALRCLRLFEAKCNASMPNELEEMMPDAADKVDDVEILDSQEMLHSTEVIDVETFVIDCLIVGQIKPDPDAAERLASECEGHVKVEAFEAVPGTVALAQPCAETSHPDGKFSEVNEEMDGRGW